MVESMIERIALAMQEARFRLPGAGGLKGELRLASAVSRELAEIAVAAIREPTEAMVKALLAECPGRDPAPFMQAWYAMIDAALSPSALSPR